MSVYVRIKSRINFNYIEIFTHIVRYCKTIIYNFNVNLTLSKYCFNVK